MGGYPSRRWRPLAWLSGAVIVLGSVGTALKPGRPPDLGGMPNPFGLDEHAWVAYAMEAVLVLRPLWQRLLEDAIALSFAGIPVAVGFAVLRYRLYDIDFFINRALVYGSLTLSLAVVYFGGVTV